MSERVEEEVALTSRPVHSIGLRLIAIFKLIKGSALVVAGLGILHLVHRDAAFTVEDWVMKIRVDPGNRVVNAVIERLSGVSDRQLEVFDVGTFFYAALLLTEGIGLLLEKRWAEYFTVIVTASFIPLEIYEIVERVTPARLVVLAINVAIVGYLIRRLRRERVADRAAAG